MTRVGPLIVPLAGLLAALVASAVAVRAWRGEHALADGREAQRRGDINAAADAYGLALADGNADAAIEHARLELLRRDWDGAAESLRTAMALAPARGSAHVLRVKLEAQRPGPWDGAREERVLGGCRTAVALDPVRGERWRDCAGIMVELMGRRRGVWDPARTRAVREEAADSYSEALRLQPRETRAILESALVRSADPTFLALVVVRGGGTPGLAAAVNLLLDRALWMQAEPAFWVAATARGRVPDFAAVAADALVRRGGFPEALTVVRRGLSVEPADPGLAERLENFTARLASSEKAPLSKHAPGRGAP